MPLNLSYHFICLVQRSLSAVDWVSVNGVRGEREHVPPPRLSCWIWVLNQPPSGPKPASLIYNMPSPNNKPVCLWPFEQKLLCLSADNADTATNYYCPEMHARAHTAIIPSLHTVA